MKIVLKYIGDGAYIVGVPATDLTAEQVSASGYSVVELLAFRPAVYAVPEPVKADSKATKEA